MTPVARAVHVGTWSWTAHVAIAAIVLLSACNSGDDVAEPDATGPPVASPSSTSIPSPAATVTDGHADILPFVDEFDDDANGWGGPYQRFEDGDYVWDLPSGQRDVRAADALIRFEDEIDDIAVTTTFTVEGIGGVGVQCAFEELEGSSRWYDLELGTDGATIRKQGLGTTPLETLATNSDVTLPSAGTPVELRASCTPSDDQYTLRLDVDGVRAVEAVDVEPFGRAGAPNLAAIALPGDDGSDEHLVRFHHFEVVSNQ